MILPRMREINRRFYLAALELASVGKCFDELIGVLEEGEEEMKKFKEGFAYVRTKTTSKRGKKPVVHCVEPERNKRKLD